MEFLNDEYFMRQALRQAEKAAELGEVPVGAVAVLDNVIIARSGNMVEQLKDATAHAEMLVITQAANHIGDWRLDRVEIFVTKEPCAMCAGAMVNAHLKRVVFALPDPKYGACGSALNVTVHPGALWHVESAGGILENESKALMQEFFRRVRNRKS
ncbi:MAG: nucleoside deaminase [Victivallaceae bacterium]